MLIGERWDVFSLERYPWGYMHLLGAQRLLDVFRILSHDFLDIIIKMNLDRVVCLLNYHAQEFLYLEANLSRKPTLLVQLSWGFDTCFNVY
jgi:hypothetical protein